MQDRIKLTNAAARFVAVSRRHNLGSPAIARKGLGTRTTHVPKAAKVPECPSAKPNYETITEYLTVTSFLYFTVSLLINED